MLREDQIKVAEGYLRRAYSATDSQVTYIKLCVEIALTILGGIRKEIEEESG